MKFIILAVILSLTSSFTKGQLASSSSSSGAALQWGSDQSNSFSFPAETILKKSNVAGLHLQWNYNLSGDAIYASVVAKDGLVYFITGFAGALYALNTSNGQPFQGFNNGQPIVLGVGPFGYDSGSTPAIYGDSIIACIDNLTLWKYNRFSGLYDSKWPTSGTVAASVYNTVPGVDGTYQAEFQASVRVATDSHGDAYIVMVTSSAAEVEEPPLEKGTVTSFNAVNAVKEWSQVIGGANTDANGMGSWSTPAIANDVVFFGTSNPQAPPAGPYSDSLQARSLSNGALLWNTQFTANDVSSQAYPIGIGNPVYQVDRDMGGSPNILPNGLVGLAGKDGIYHALNQTTGVQVWSTVLTPTPISLGNPSASVFNGVVYAAATSDVSADAYVLSPTYRYPIIDWVTQIVGYGGFSGYLSNEQSVYYLARILLGCKNSTGVIKALNAANGNVIWSKSFPTAFFGTPVYANGLLYVGSYDGTLRVLDASNGNVLFAQVVTPVQDPVDTGFGYNFPLPPNLPILTSVAVVNGQVLVPYSSISFSGSGVLALSL